MLHPPNDTAPLETRISLYVVTFSGSHPRPILRVLYTHKLNRLTRLQWKIKFIFPISSSAYSWSIYSGKFYKRHKFIYSKYTSNVTNDVIHDWFGLYGQVTGKVTKKSQ